MPSPARVESPRRRRRDDEAGPRAHTRRRRESDAGRRRRDPLASADPAEDPGGRVMGTIYRRQVRFCTTCDRRLDTTAARQACDVAGHAIEIREQGPWWIKYQVSGRPQCVSSSSDKKEDAKRLLKAREGDVVKGA